MCPACRGGQFARRGDPLCPACARAALEVAPSPLWALDSPLLRNALAEVNVPAMVAIVRAACGLSQREMAEVVGWSPAVLSYYERGRRDAVFDVRVMLQFADGVGMPRAALLALVLADPDASGADNWPALDCAPGIALRRVTAGRLRYWQACTDALYERDRRAGGTALLRAALQLRWQVSAGLCGLLSAELRVAMAEVLLYAGNAALDAGSVVLAKSLHDKARELTVNAGYPVLTVHLLLAQAELRLTIAWQGGSREPARQALLLAREAADEGRYEPVPQLHALIAIRTAQAAALLSDKPGFDAAITRARRELDRQLTGSVPLPGWLRHAGHADVTAAEAAGCLNLGETARAVALHRTALELAGCPRDRARAAAGLASALMASGDRAEAVAAALGVAVPALREGVVSARCVEQLRHVAAAAGVVRGTLELREQLDGLCQEIPQAPDSGAAKPVTLASVPA